MSLKELDGGLVALMEIHCREYRLQYGHLRTDGRGHLEPIPFPSRQMPTFFQLQAASNKGLKLWIQIERTLYDHYETPVDLGRYSDIGPRQTGKATRAGFLATLLDIAIPMPTHHKAPPPPIRIDIRPIDWDAILYGGRKRPQLRGIGGHADKEDIHVVGVGGRPERFNFDRLRDIWKPSNFNLDYQFRMVDDDEPPEAEHSTDYQRKKGWKRIPLQIPNPAKPSPVLLALLKRSA